MDKELMKGSIDILILSIIKNEDNYGYEISKCIKERCSGLYTMGEGTMYPALKRLEEKQLIESYWKESELANKRKYYRITSLGKKSLDERINQWNKITELINIFKEA